MSDDIARGPNVRRLSYLDLVTKFTIRFNPDPAGDWTARIDSGGLVQAHIERGADVETAAANMIDWIEANIGLVPEPPEDFWKGV